MATPIAKLTALQLYTAVLAELDKTNAASFTITNFNYYLNRSQLKLQADLVDIFEQTQVLSDALSPFIRTAVYTLFTVPPIVAETCKLPTDYEQTLRARCTYTVAAAFPGYRAGDTLVRTPKRLTADQQAYVEEPNHYFKPTFDRTYRRVVAGLLQILSGVHSKLVLTRVDFEYICRPDQAELYEADVLDLTVDNSQVLQWTPKFSYELVRYITADFMELGGNPRLGTYKQVNRPNVGAPPSPQAGQPAAQRAAQQDQAQQQQGS